MPASDDSVVEVAGELVAYRAACLFLIKTLGASLVSLKEPGRTQIIEEIERKFTERRGELLYVSPPDLSPNLQAIGNRAIQKTLKSISTEISQSLRGSASQ